MPLRRRDSRMVRSAGVHEPHREFWLSTQRTVAGCARPARYFDESTCARSVSASSDGRRFCSERSRRASIVLTQSRSSAFVMRAGSRTTTEPSSLRYAETVRRRRRLRLTSTSVRWSTGQTLLVASRPSSYFGLRPRRDDSFRRHAVRRRTGGPVVEEVELPRRVRVAVDREQAAQLERQVQQVVGRVAALRTPVDLHRDAVL